MNTLFEAKNSLGEGPTWHKERNSLFWVDIEQHKLHEYKFDAQNTHIWTLPFCITSVSIETFDSVILTTENKIVRYNLKSETIEIIYTINEINTNNLRLNDGKCDASGKLWVGSMDKACKNSIGCLYSFDSDYKFDKKIENIILSNGMAWSKDAKKMYYIDSMTYVVKTFAFDLHTGNIVFDKICITIPESLGIPDGMTIDNEGMLWIAIWGGFCVSRWNPETGQMLEKVNLPAPNISSCTFGGENTDTLFITSARQGLSEEEISKYPESGNVFSHKPQVGGYINHYFSS